MQHSITTSFAILVTAMLLTTPPVLLAQSTGVQQQLILSQIQTDQRAIVLRSLELDDAQVAAFTPIYDAYQAEYKKVMDRAVALIDTFASNHDSLTNEAAERLLRDWFQLKGDEDRLIRDYSRKMGKVLPSTKVLRFVQIENKLSTILRLEAMRHIPLAK